MVKLASGVCALGMRAGSSHLEQETGDPIREAMSERERNQRFRSWSTE
jgi:hypothetical protein